MEPAEPHLRSENSVSITAGSANEGPRLTDLENTEPPCSADAHTVP